MTNGTKKNMGPKVRGGGGEQGRGPKPGKGGAPQGGAAKGGGPKGGAPKGGGPKISRFFFLLPPPFSFFFSLSGGSSCVIFSLSGCLLVSFFLSLGVFSWNFGGVLVGRDLKCLFSPLGCRVEASGGLQAGGICREWMSNFPKRAHLSVLALQTPPKFHEKTPGEREREKKIENEGGSWGVFSWNFGGV